MENAKQWYEGEFMPWKNAMKAREDEQRKMVENVKRKSAELKYVVSLLLEKRELEAVKVWNDMGMQPQLTAINLDLGADTLHMNTKEGQALELSLDAVLAELQAML